MIDHQASLSYCFNSLCSNSIINKTRSNIGGIELEIALASNFKCPYCGEELISAVLIMMREKVLDLISDEQSNIVLLDDDLTFHFFVKQSLNKELTNTQYYTDGYAVLNQLVQNIDNEDTLPDIIFLDLHMPILNGWNFLDLFQVITKNLIKKIEIYIISACEDAEFDLSKYPFVKCFISKKSTLQFFKMLNQDLSEKQISKPRISMYKGVN